MGRKKTVATRSVGNKPLDKEVSFKHVLRHGEIQLIVLTQGGLSLREQGKLGIALGHGAEDLIKQNKKLYRETQSIMYPLKKKENNEYLRVILQIYPLMELWSVQHQRHPIC
jgi:hypothetical protein